MLFHRICSGTNHRTHIVHCTVAKGKKVRQRPFRVDFYNCLQVLGQCKGVISAVVSVLCFHNMVPTLGWCGYSVTVGGCLLYGRCKVQSRMQASKHLHKSSTYNLQYLNLSLPNSATGTPRTPEEERDQILTETSGRRNAPVFRMGAFEETAATTQESMESGNGRPHGRMGFMPMAMDTPLAMGGKKSHDWGGSNVSMASSLSSTANFSDEFAPSATRQVKVAAPPAYTIQSPSVAVR